VNNTHDVISAFLDDRPFEPEALADALDDPAGRTLLIDLIVLRRLVQPTDAVPPVRVAGPRRRSPWRALAAAAALILALGGGYIAGERRAATAPVEAPAPSRVVEAVPFVPTGGVR
jgi:hypothetical protein